MQKCRSTAANGSAVLQGVPRFWLMGTLISVLHSSRPVWLKVFEREEYKDAGAQRRDEIIGMQRPETKKSRRRRPEQRQGEGSGDSQKYELERAIGPPEGRCDRRAETAVYKELSSEPTLRPMSSSRRWGQLSVCRAASCRLTSLEGVAARCPSSGWSLRQLMCRR